MSSAAQVAVESHWQELMIKSQQGDRIAYAELLDALYPVIRKYLLSKVGRLVDIDDFTQECVISIHKARHTYDPSRKFAPWMYAVIKYKMIDLLRKREKTDKQETLDEKNLVTFGHDPTKDDEDEVQLVQQALQTLPKDMRRAVELTKIQGLSTDDAAAKEGVSHAAIRTRISRAYQLLRKKMERQFGQ